jgi:hypothetical protein
VSGHVCLFLIEPFSLYSLQSERNRSSKFFRRCYRNRTYAGAVTSSNAARERVFLMKLTTRRWMIAVAVVGLLLGVVVGGRRLKKRRDYCLQQASNYARMESFFRSMEWRSTSVPRSQRPLIIMDGHTYQADTMADYYAEMEESYLHSASRPWISVPPDPQKGEILILNRFPQTFVFEKTGRALSKSGHSPSF